MNFSAIESFLVVRSLGKQILTDNGWYEDKNDEKNLR